MTDIDLLAALTDAQTVGLTLFGEARGERIEGRLAVASVIGNRVKAHRAAFGRGFKGVCLKRWQFSCWLPEGGKANYDLVMAAAQLLARGDTPGPMLRECLWIADGLIRDQFGDTVRTATHYYNPHAMVPRGRVPDWAQGQTPVATVGSHLFYAGIR